MLATVVDAIPPMRTPSGRRRVRPGKLEPDRGYTARPTMPGCLGVGSPPDRSAWDRAVDPLGRHRWRVERALEVVPLAVELGWRPGR
jgi:hypothetical protein